MRGRRKRKGGGRREGGRRGGGEERRQLPSPGKYKGGRRRSLRLPVGWARCRGPWLESRSTWDRDAIVDTGLSYSYNGFFSRNNDIRWGF